MGGKYGQEYRYATHITKVFVKRTKLFLECWYKAHIDNEFADKAFDYFSLVPQLKLAS